MHFILVGLVALLHTAAAAAPSPLKLTLLPTKDFKAQSCTLLLTSTRPLVRFFNDQDSRLIHDENGLRGEAFSVTPEALPALLKQRANPDEAESFAFAFAAQRERRSRPGSVRAQVLDAVHQMIRNRAPGQVVRMEFPLFEELPAGVRDPRPLEYSVSQVANWSAMSLTKALHTPRYVATMPHAFGMMVKEYWQLLKFRLNIPSAATRPYAPFLVYLPQSTPGYGVLSFLHLNHAIDPQGTFEAGFVLVEVERTK